MAKGDTEDVRKTDSNHAAASVGRCPPDPLGFFALALEMAGACRAGQNEPGPLFAALQAAPKPGPRGILSWAVADVEPTNTRGPHSRASALVSFCSLSLLLQTTNRLLLLTRMSPFARTATAFSMRLRGSTVALSRRWDCVSTELQHQETHERGYDQG